MSKIYLINVSGDDRPGEFSSLMEVLANYGAFVLDLNQVVIHKNLALGFMIEMPSTANDKELIATLVTKATDLKLNLKHSAVEEKDYLNWVNRQGKEKHIVTVLGKRLSAEPLSKVSRIIVDQGLNIDIITRLTGRPQLRDHEGVGRACFEFSVRGTPKDEAAMKASFMEVAHNLDVDISFQKDNLYRRHRRLVAFDMDSTLIKTEVIDELAREAGVYDQVSKITESAMRGELDFKQSLKKRLGLLKGLPESTLQKVAARLPLMDGAQKLLKNLKAVGLKTAIISGGFTYFGEHLSKMLGIDYVFANRLEIKNGVLTGEVIGDIVDAAKKAENLRLLAAREAITLDQVIAVGDGANDLPMLSIAGLGIAFHAKPIVRQGAKHSISTLGLDGILYLMGLRDRDITF